MLARLRLGQFDTARADLDRLLVAQVKSPDLKALIEEAKALSDELRRTR